MSTQTKKSSRSATISGLRCGGCYHFKHARSKVHEDVCSKLGVVRDATPCEKYLPSPDALRISKRENATRLAMHMLASTPTSDLPALAALIAGENITRKHGFYFGEIVYIKVFGKGTHLNHFARARVVRADSRNVFLQGVENPFSAQLSHSSVIRQEDFALFRRKCTKTGSVIDPVAEAFFKGSKRKDVHNVEDVIDQNTGKVAAKVKSTAKKKSKKWNTVTLR